MFDEEWWKAHFAVRPFQPLILQHALAMRVLCVAKSREEGAWAAYCNAVPGEDHYREQEAVLRHGDKLREDVARALFPQFNGVPYAL